VSPRSRVLIKDVEALTSQLLVELGGLERQCLGDEVCRVIRRKVDRYCDRVKRECDAFERGKN
jgi:hypothetical protein